MSGAEQNKPIKMRNCGHLILNTGSVKLCFKMCQPWNLNNNIAIISQYDIDMAEWRRRLVLVLDQYKIYWFS